MGAAFYDVAVFGKTGNGKSTTANILLGTKDNNREDENVKPWIGSEDLEGILNKSKVPYFETWERVEACTKKCQVMSRGTIRVLDIPGFYDCDCEDDVNNKQSIFENNLQLIRKVIRVQDSLGLSFSLFLYFLPQRGPLRRMDRIVLDELKLFYHYFDREIFENMLIVVTNDIHYQNNGFSEADITATAQVLGKMLEKISQQSSRGTQPPKCPPVIYIPIGMTSEQLLDKIAATGKSQFTGLTLRIAKDVCAKCGWRITKVNDEPFQATNGQEVVPHNQSACHPRIISRYTWGQKILGGFGHFAAMGVGLLYELVSGNPTWPGFTNSDEMCVQCKRPPGQLGCRNIGTEYQYEYETKLVQHSNEVN